MKHKLDKLSSQVIQAAITVHRELGPGLLESVYIHCMVIELAAMGVRAQSEVPLPVVYKGTEVTEAGFRLDLVVEDSLIAELKSVEAILPIHKKQLLTYLRLANKPLGLLINFNKPLIKEGIARVINSFIPPEGGMNST